MDMLYILVCFLLILICIELTIFTCAVLYAFLVAAYDVVSDWVLGLKWRRRKAKKEE